MAKIRFGSKAVEDLTSIWTTHIGLGLISLIIFTVVPALGRMRR